MIRSSYFDKAHGRTFVNLIPADYLLCGNRSTFSTTTWFPQKLFDVKAAEQKKAKQYSFHRYLL
jgi:hypothetical protein